MTAAAASTLFSADCDGRPKRPALRRRNDDPAPPPGHSGLPRSLERSGDIALHARRKHFQRRRTTSAAVTPGRQCHHAGATGGATSIVPGNRRHRQLCGQDRPCRPTAILIIRVLDTRAGAPARVLVEQRQETQWCAGAAPFSATIDRDLIGKKARGCRSTPASNSAASCASVSEQGLPAAGRMPAGAGRHYPCRQGRRRGAMRRAILAAGSGLSLALFAAASLAQTVARHLTCMAAETWSSTPRRPTSPYVGTKAPSAPSSCSASSSCETGRPRPHQPVHPRWPRRSADTAPSSQPSLPGNRERYGFTGLQQVYSIEPSAKSELVYWCGSGSQVNSRRRHRLCPGPGLLGWPGAVYARL